MSVRSLPMIQPMRMPGRPYAFDIDDTDSAHGSSCAASGGLATAETSR